MKELTAPAASVADSSSEFFLFNSEFVESFSDDNTQKEAVKDGPGNLDLEPYHGSPSIFENGPCAMSIQTPDKELWGLFDTGATHYMFNKIDMFEALSVTAIASDGNNKLKLAGGNSKLIVKSKGTVKLKAGDNSEFEFTNCLYIPDLNRHLIAGGLLLRKGVQIIVNPSNSKCFSLVFKNKALFNGVFLDNNLMLVRIIPVSDFTSTKKIIPEALSTEMNSRLLHRRLGHVSERYLRIMCREGCLDGSSGMEVKKEECEVCAKSKGTKLPHSGTRPRAT